MTLAVEIRLEFQIHSIHQRLPTHCMAFLSEKLSDGLFKAAI